jgi:ribosomal protein S18 acetylase RimI-like enzyme
VTGEVAIRPLRPAHAAACDGIVESLPYHFGDAGGRELCARAVRESSGLVAEAGGAVVGFLTWRRCFPGSFEITWMAVHADHRRHGIGRSLIDALVDSLSSQATHIVVTTLSAATPEPELEDTYAGTRRFYRNNGFEPLWEPQGWWNERNQALLMLRSIGA